MEPESAMELAQKVTVVEESNNLIINSGALNEHRFFIQSNNTEKNENVICKSS